MNSEEILKAKIKDAESVLSKANLSKDYYTLLIGFDVKEDIAFRYALSLDFQNVLNSKEFTRGEKTEVIRLQEQYKQPARVF